MRLIAFLLALLPLTLQAGVVYHESPRVVNAPPLVFGRYQYPVRPASTWYTGPHGRMLGREAMVAHLKSGEHAGKFDHAWLDSLTNEKLQSLHSDDHTGAVQWSYVRRPAALRFQFAPQSNCPGGFCPKGAR